MIAFCQKLPHATRDIKWGNDLVFSVARKMFACFDAHGGTSISFKTTPENFRMLTRTPGIMPAPYAARFHWVMVKDLRELPIDGLKELVRESYEIVRDKLPAKVRRQLDGESNDPRKVRRPNIKPSRVRKGSRKRR